MGKTLCDLFKDFESTRKSAAINAAIDEQIEDIEFDIYMYRCALELLNVENIEDIKKLEGKFEIIFKDDLGLQQLVGMDTPSGVSIHTDDCDLWITIVDNDPEMLDEHFGELIESVNKVIYGLKQQIDELVGKKTS